MSKKIKDCDDMCEWCGKHIPAGTEHVEIDEFHVYCSEECAEEDGQIVDES